MKASSPIEKAFVLLVFAAICGTVLASAEVSRPPSDAVVTVMEPGLGAKIVQGDVVKIAYKATTIDGTLVDSASVDRAIVFKVGDKSTIAGVSRGVLGQQAGSRLSLRIPPELGYGTRSVGRIPPNSVLQFEVEILAVGRRTLSELISQKLNSEGLAAVRNWYRDFEESSGEGAHGDAFSDIVPDPGGLVSLSRQLLYEKADGGAAVFVALAAKERSKANSLAIGNLAELYLVAGTREDALRYLREHDRVYRATHGRNPDRAEELLLEKMERDSAESGELMKLECYARNLKLYRDSLVDIGQLVERFGKYLTTINADEIPQATRVATDLLGLSASRDSSAHQKLSDLLRLSSIETVRNLVSPETISQDPADKKGRPWTPADSVNLTFLACSNLGIVGDASLSPLIQAQVFTPQFITWSPNSKFFFLVVHRPDLKKDENCDQIVVFDAAEVYNWTIASDRSTRVAVPTKCSATFASNAAQYAGIKDVRWDSSGRNILFLGKEKTSVQQLYSLSIASGKVSRVTNSRQPVSRGADFASGYAIYSTQSTARFSFSPNWQYPATPVPLTADGSWRVVSPPSNGGVSYLGTPDGRVVSLPVLVDKSWLSPSGQQAVVLTWVNRTPKLVLLDFRGKNDAIGVRDISTKISATPFGTPGIVWARDESMILVGNLNSAAMGASESGGETAVGTYSIDTASWRVLGKLPSRKPALLNRTEVFWDEERSAFVGRYLEDGIRIWEDRMDSIDGTHNSSNVNWAERDREPGFNHQDLRIAVKQDANTPPTVIASTRESSAVIFEVNPELAGIQRSSMKIISFKDRDGVERRAGLWLPVDGSASRRPLVIQVYGFQPDYFQPDGVMPSVDAAQSLAARGIAVVELDTQDVAKPMATEFEKLGPRIESLLDSLKALGTIDLSKIGMVGFSHGGYQVFYSITHPGKYAITAAVMADSYRGTYSDYLKYAADSLTSVGAHEALGGGSFWQSRDKWLREETTFNVDRVMAPALFTIHGSNETQDGDTSSIRELFGAFRLNRKPFECIVFPKGEHSLRLPAERFYSIGKVVDWMCFWLKGEAPSDYECAARWAILRKQQDEVLKTPPPPKGKWVFQPDPVQPEWHPPGETKKEEPKPEPTGANKN